MWPKAFAQLVELAPHISRLLPMADRFFQNKTAGDDATRKAIESMGANVRADLNQITVAHAGLSDQISDLGKKLNRLEADTEGAKLSTESFDRRLAVIETRQSRLMLLLALALLLLVVICVLEGLLLAHAR